MKYTLHGVNYFKDNIPHVNQEQQLHRNKQQNKDRASGKCVLYQCIASRKRCNVIMLEQDEQKRVKFVTRIHQEYCRY